MVRNNPTNPFKPEGKDEERSCPGGDESGPNV